MNDLLPYDRVTDRAESQGQSRADSNEVGQTIQTNEESGRDLKSKV